MVNYTSIWEGFQFRSVCYVNNLDYVDPYKFDLVKWEKHAPMEVTDWETGEKKISTSNCFSIGTLIWDEKEEYFHFKTCGMRYFEYYRPGLNEWIKAFADLKAIELQDKDDEEDFYDEF